MNSAGIHDRARPGLGEAAASGSDALNLDTALAALQGLTTQELRQEFRRLYRVDPPRRLSRDLLLRATAYRYQERVHGGLDFATRRRLDALAAELKAKGAAHFEPRAVLKPGTRLVRDWRGRTHAVTVLDSGFEYEGQRYRSLTRIASLITGVHWSGPVFFGLKQRPRAVSEPIHD